MFSREIEDLLHKSLNRLPVMVCARTLRHDIDELVAMVFHGLRLAVVADSHTEQALGREVWRALKSRFAASYILFEGSPEAEMAAAEYIRSQAAGCDALVAVGSGTINDLCKYAAFADGKPYAVFPTAASMNGYCSANASLVVDGFKKTQMAAMPQAVFCDLGVIAAAPAPLAKSGLGDCLARPTAQADWLLSHLLLATPYDETPFSLLKGFEPALFGNARGIAKGDPAAIETLLHILLLSGLGMTMAGGSYPASQGEHMIAHAMEMIRDRGQWRARSRKTLHGEEIGVLSLMMAHRQRKVLQHPPRLQLPPFPEEKLALYFGETVMEEARSAYAAKLALVEKSGIALSGKGLWDKVQECLPPVMMPPEQIHAILEAAETAITIEDLGWSPVLFPNAANSARFLRDRFTSLDLGK